MLHLHMMGRRLVYFAAFLPDVSHKFVPSSRGAKVTGTQKWHSIKSPTLSDGDL
jgi:hypothetical protein